MKFSYGLILVLAAVVAAGGAFLFRPEPKIGENHVPMPEPSLVDDTVQFPPEPSGAAAIEPVARVVRATLQTSKGDIKVSLDGTRAPVTVGSFISLAEGNYYDGTTFHRVIPDFMIQGGDPFSKDQTKREAHGTGGPGYQFIDEINAASYGLHERKLADAVAPQQLEQLTEEARVMTIQQFYEAQGYRYTTEVESLPLRRGVLAMANSGPNTNGSQFFIITAESVAHLEGKHTPFGIVEEGMDVVMAISGVETDENDNPLEPVIVEDVIVDKGPQDALQFE